MFAPQSPESLALIGVVFLLAGWVKGVVGMGLPTVAMGALGLVMAPVQAAAILIIPSLVTNVWQFATGPAKWLVTRRLAGMMLLLCIGTALGVPLLVSSSSRWPTLALGAVLAAYALLALFLPRMTVSVRAERILSPLVGFVTGVLTGATGVFVVPAVPYLSALAFTRDELVQALGLSFTVSTVALAMALAFAPSLAAGGGSALPQSLLLASLAAVLPALAGMFIGQRMRERIEPVRFRRWFFIAMLLVGALMVSKGIAGK